MEGVKGRLIMTNLACGVRLSASERSPMAVSTDIIFRSARQYHTACERLRNAATAEEAIQVGYPCIYMAIMASELYLKCLVFRLHGNVPHHHILERLFGALDAEIRSAIVKKWDIHVGSLEKEVAHISKHFGAPIDTSFVGYFEVPPRLMRSFGIFGKRVQTATPCYKTSRVSWRMSS